jgi:hypothetical protein
MLGVIARRTRYCDGFRNLRVDIVSVTAFAASVDEAIEPPFVSKPGEWIGSDPNDRQPHIYLVRRAALEQERHRLAEVGLRDQGFIQGQ